MSQDVAEDKKSSIFAHLPKNRNEQQSIFLLYVNNSKKLCEKRI